MFRSIVISVIRFYQRGVSPFMPAACRYRPTCSEYAKVAVERHGVARGGWLAVRRIGRCHPWGGSGLDPVPPAAPRERARSRDDAPHLPAHLSHTPDDHR